MKVGDLVTSNCHEYRGSVGMVKEIWTAGSPQWIVEVLWNNGVTGSYYARQLEVICK